MLRESASHLSPTRDAHVKIKAFKNLVQHFRPELGPGALHHIRKALLGGFQQATWTFAKEKTAGRVERILKRTAADFNDLSVCRKGWKVLSTGLKSSYGQGFNKYHIALKDPSIENLHEWRKRIKDLWYQIRLLNAVWPEQMDAAAQELETLSEFLGDDHDLVMLQIAATECCEQDGKLEEWELLQGLIKQRQAELRKAAFTLGARFYAEKPSAFCKRLGKYWQIWRHKKTSALPTAEQVT